MSGVLIVQESSATRPWPISRVANQVVLYDPTSHALSIRTSGAPVGGLQPNTSTSTGNNGRLGPSSHDSTCPYCGRSGPEEPEQIRRSNNVYNTSDEEDDPAIHSRVSNYFQLLQIANQSTSRPSTPPPPSPLFEQGEDEAPSQPTPTGAFSPDAMAHGYFQAFFREECRLGMGANGSVYLCQHMLDGNSLGHFAVKKIAVGESHSYLVNILKEVRLLERLHHPNIITYHHSWLETSQFSLFGPRVPTLHVLMQWAEGGSLDDFIDSRLGRHSDHGLPDHNSNTKSHLSPAPLTANLSESRAAPGETAATTRAARIRAFRALQRTSPEERAKLQREANSVASGMKNETWTPVHLLSGEEMRSLFGDIVEGLAFLHDKSILHLDLKPGNVLLTWDEGRLVPRALLSDFGTSRDMLSSKARSGNTGTLEYCPPEAISPLAQVDSKTDMWSLGMILHKLLFFRLPYQNSEAQSGGSHRTGEAVKMERLEQEIIAYPGFKSTSALVTAFEIRRLPRGYLVLLENLLNVAPGHRPACERLLVAVREGKLDPLTRTAPLNSTQLVPILRKPVPATSGEPSQDAGETPRPSFSKSNSQDFVPRPRSPPKSGYELWGFRVSVPRTLWTRSFKSLVLAAKVLSLAYYLPVLPSPAIVGAIVSIAVVDTWFESLRVSAGLGVLHLLALHFMY